MCDERHVQQPIHTTITLVASALANGPCAARCAHRQLDEAREGRRQRTRRARNAGRWLRKGRSTLPHQTVPLAPRSRNALTMTDTELRLMASAAMSGDSNKPVNENNTPAATGTPSEL